MKSAFDLIAGGYHFLMNLFSCQSKIIFFLKEHSALMSQHRVLDVGGGSGIVAEALHSEVHEFVVLDPSKQMMSHIQSKNITAIQGIARLIPFSDAYFDVIYCVDSLHHFTNGHAQKNWDKELGLCLAEIARVLKHNGRLIIVEFDPSKFGTKKIQFFENIIFRFGSYFLTPKELEQKLKPFGFSFSLHYVNKHTYALIASKQ